MLVMFNNNEIVLQGKVKITSYWKLQRSPNFFVFNVKFEQKLVLGLKLIEYNKTCRYAHIQIRLFRIRKENINNK